MLKNITRIEHKIGDRLYHLTCDQDSPISEVKDALCQFMGQVTQIENRIKEAQAQAASAPPPEVPESDKIVPIEKVD